jgi:hypothetical protein
MNSSRAAGAGIAGAIVNICIWIWPSPGGRVWEPDVVAALTAIFCTLGVYLAPLGAWLVSLLPKAPTPPPSALLVLLMLLPLGCASARNNSGLSAIFGNGQSCNTGDDADCTSVGKGGRLVWVEGGSVTVDRATGAVSVTDAELIEILDGPGTRSTSSGQSLGSALNNSISLLGALAEKNQARPTETDDQGGVDQEGEEGLASR